MKNQTGNARRILLGIATLTSIIFGVLIGGVKWGVVGYILGGLIGGVLAIISVWLIGVLLIGMLSIMRNLAGKRRYGSEDEIDATARTAAIISPFMIIIITLVGIFMLWNR